MWCNHPRVIHAMKHFVFYLCSFLAKVRTLILWFHQKLIFFVCNTCIRTLVFSLSDKTLSRKMVSEAFWNQHVEDELRERLCVRASVFYKDADREILMKEIESIRRESAYNHDYCSDDCKKRGKGY